MANGSKLSNGSGARLEPTTNDAQATILASTVEAQTSFLMGRVLTIADASFSDKDQRKAVKDLLRGAIRDYAERLDSFVQGNGAMRIPNIGAALSVHEHEQSILR